MNETKQSDKKILPEEVLLNALADCGRIERIVIIVDTKDGCYETWSNNLDLVERSGLINIAKIRTDRYINKMEDVDKDEQ